MSATETASRGPNLSNAVRAKKLTIDRVAGDRLTNMLKEKIEGSKEQGVRWLADFYCFVTGTKRETSPYGDYYRWLGDFKSLNIATGEVLQSANAIFPGIASDLIEAAYVGGNNIGGEAANVMLAFRVGIECCNPDRANKSGYEFRLQDIVRPSTRSPLDMLYEEANVPLLTQTHQQGRVPDEAEKPHLGEVVVGKGKGGKA